MFLSPTLNRQISPQIVPVVIKLQAVEKREAKIRDSRIHQIDQDECSDTCILNQIDSLSTQALDEVHWLPDQPGQDYGDQGQQPKAEHLNVEARNLQARDWVEALKDAIKGENDLLGARDYRDRVECLLDLRRPTEIEFFDYHNSMEVVC